MMDQPICLICGSNEDFICFEHQELIQSNYNTTTNTTMMAVIGNILPRSSDVYADELPMISTHETLEKFHDMLDEWEKDQIDVASYSFLVRFAKGTVSSLTHDDITFLLVTNFQVTPLALIFETDDDLKDFTKKYESYIEPSVTLPVVVIHSRLDSVLEYLRDTELPSELLVCYVSRR